MVRTLFLLTICATATATAWHCHTKHEFQVAGCNGIVVAAKIAANKPWIWRARFPDYHPEYGVAMGA